MMTQEIFEAVARHMDEIAQGVITQPVQELLSRLAKIHPADIAEWLEGLSHEDACKIFVALPQELQVRIFHECGHMLQVSMLETLSESERSDFLQHLSIDDLTDFFDDLSDEELKRYLKLLHKKDRDRVISLLQFSPDSAGGIMYTDVLTLMQDLTVAKSIHILQRLRPSRALHHKIYVTTQNNELVGHINLEDLVLKSPTTRLRFILRTDELVAQVDEDRQDVVNKMLHYGVSNIPVVGHDQTFLGVIPSEVLAETIEDEASEDIYRMSALSPIKYTYFETSFGRLLYQRSSILIVLLLVQTLSSMIVRRYDYLLCGFLTYFMSMLISTGGNASSQTSALAIQGMATGEIDIETSRRFITRELLMASIIGAILGIFSFGRTYFVHRILSYDPSFSVAGGLAVSVSLMVIVIVSIFLGSALPFVLKRFGLDPAHSAGPLLTTIIDVIGLLIYCLVSSWIFSIFGVVK